MSERTDRMRKRMLMTHNPICIEKFRIEVETNAAYPNEPAALVQGRILKAVLEQFPIFIQEDELLVGNGASKPFGLELSAGYGVWDQSEIDALKKEGFPMDPEDEKELMELNEKCKPVGLMEGLNLVIEDHPLLDHFVQSGVMLPPWKKNVPGNNNRSGGGRAQTGLGPNPGWGFFCLDFEMILQKGLRTMIQECRDKLSHMRFDEKDSYMQAINLKSMIMGMEGMITFANRFSELARQMAQSEKREWRRAELMEISEICAHVPANPARTFREAMQFHWFIMLCSMLPSQATALGRMDQIMYPYYKADIAAGRITDEQVIELFECLRLKCMEQECLFGVEGRKRADGKAKWHTVTIGGVKRDGSDASNELTLHILEALMRCPTTHHTISLRVAESTPDAVMKKAVQAQAMGLTMPAFVGDASYIKYFTDNGVPLEEARNYCISGCNDGVVPGLSLRISANMTVPLRTLQLWLNDGVDERTGLRVAPPSGDLDRFSDFEEFYAAYIDGMHYYEDLIGQRTNLETMVFQTYYPCPVPACFMTHGIEQAKGLYAMDYILGEISAFCPVGMVNLGESLFTIKKLVYEDRVLTLSEFKEILDHDWEGHEDLRQQCKELPKYGNDIESVDEMVSRVYNDWADGFRPLRFGSDQYNMPAAVSITAYDPGGAVCGASPDGRKRGEIVADACASPESSADTSGFLAVLKSGMRLPQDRYSSFLLNQKFHPSALASESDYLKLAHAIKVYFANHGKHIQFNVVDKATLLDAQAHPENYPGLMVRVAGYSAYFTILSRKIQDQLIARTSHDCL